MNALRVVFRLELLIGLAFAMPGMPTTAQNTPAKEAQSTAPGLIKLAGDDEKRVKQLDEQIDQALKADRWDEAIARAEELVALRTRIHGPKHFETVNAEWRLKALRRAAAMQQEDRAAYQSARSMDKHAETLWSQGNYAAAQPLCEKVLEIRRRLLTDEHPLTAQSYNNLAYNLNSQGKHAQAQPLYETALEIRRTLLTDEHPLTAQSYNNLAHNLNARGKYTQAQPLFEKAVEINRRLLGDDHPDTPKGYTNLANNLNAQGKYTQAQPFYEKALEINRRLLTDDHPLTAASYNNLAYNLNSQGKYAQAQPLYEKALEIRRRLLTDEHPLTAQSYNSVGHNLDANGKHAAAQPLFEKALAIRRRLLGEDHPNTVTSYNNLAANLNRQGKYAEAQPLFEKALEMRRRRITDNHRDTATSYNNLALNLQLQGKHAQAQPLFVKALEIHRRLLTDDHPDTATSYNNLAANLNVQGQYSQAQALYEKAMEIRRRLLGDDHPSTSSSYNNLALNLERQGKHAQAQPLYEKALEIDRRVLTDDHPLTANTYNNLASNLSRQGKYAAAQPLFEKAVEIDRRLLGDDHPRTGRNESNLAGNLNSQGKYVEAKDRWLRAVKSLDSARLQVAFTGLERAATEQFARVRLASVLARLGQPAEAWQWLEEDLGRGLLDELAARQDRRLTSAERARLRALSTELERLDRLVEANPRRLDQAGRARRFAELRRQRELASIALGEYQTKLAQNNELPAGQVAKLNEIQPALPADAALVAWVDLAPRGPNAADPGGEHWGVVVRSLGIPTWVPIAGTGPDGLWIKDDARLAGRARTELRSRPGTGSAALPPLLEGLRTQRLEPLAKALSATTDGLPPAQRLIVLPSREMAGIPIEALLPADDTRTVSYSPSATVFKYLRARPRPGAHGSLLALGDPVCLPPLPGTRYEVEAIARLFKSDGRPSMALLAAGASEPELDRLAASGELGQFGFIHLATHGLIDEAIPERSAVILTQTALPDPLAQVMNHQPVFDGRLTVREIQRSWDVKAELVTLSACETALGREAGGEGFVGFTQALLMAGARSVCLSLWRVDDRATSLLMTRFYQNLLGKRPAQSTPMPKAEALYEAKHWLRSLTVDQINGELAAFSRGDVRPLAKADGATSPGAATLPKSSGIRPYDHPYYWAAFVLVGDPD